MSGIVGIFNLDGEPVSRGLLTRMTATLSLRGPDGASEWIESDVGFGHASLQTNQEDNPKQPVTLDGESWLTAHARIDGRLELATKLSDHFQDLKPHSFPADDYLILMAYKVWGEDCVDHLIGDFSFAIWDSRKHQLFCARDQMGVGQFYYALTNRTFVFSNSLNCLRLHPAVSSNLNEVAVGDFLLFGLNQQNDTSIFRDIQRLPRAHCLTVNSDAIRVTEYWAPRVTAISYKSKSDYVEKFKELLDEAVSDRLRSTQIGIAMSGGLDSSMVAATARSRLKQASCSTDLRAYCVVYDGAFPDDERHYAGEVARSLNVPIEFLDGALINRKTSPRTLGHAPEPFDVEPFYVVSDELLRRISTTSRVALTGWDGDTFLKESPRHLFHELWRTSKFLELSGELLRYLYFQRRPPPVGLRTWWQKRNGLEQVPAYPKWINEEFATKLSLRERWKQKAAEFSSLHAVRPHAFRNLNTPHWSALFAQFDPGVTGLPLEVRHPLIDVRLVNYLLGVPVIPWLQDKYILREAMRGVLPESIRTRRKTTLAGDPGMQIRSSEKVVEIDSFLPTPEILNYIRRDSVPQLTMEVDSVNLWINARPFSLNQWFRNSFRVYTNSSVEREDENGEYSQNRRSEPAQEKLHQAESR